MEPLTVGDIRPFLDLASSSPILDDNEGIASQLRGILNGFNVPIDADLDQALTLIENDPRLVGVGVAEFRAAVDGLPDDTLLSEIEALGGTGGGDSPVVVTPTVDADGNAVYSYTLPYSGITINVDDSGYTIEGLGVNDRISDVDRIDFADGTLYLDVADEPGVVEAAYSRLLEIATPADGFEFWVDALESAQSTVFDLAEAFVATDAFTDTYGGLLNDPTALVSEFYTNVLGRTADSAGLDFWSNFIAAAAENANVDDTVGYFLDSGELEALLTQTLDSGLFIADSPVG